MAGPMANAALMRGASKVSDLLGYLDCSGSEYDYLGHFRHERCLAQGHNTGIMGDIEGGNVGELAKDISSDRQNVAPILQQDSSQKMAQNVGSASPGVVGSVVNSYVGGKIKSGLADLFA
jgi:hypothetical protein